jgi:flagellar hook assembly protein FlgD
MGNLKIFDPQGRLVRRLAQNASLAEKQVFIWDGTDDQHRRAKNGYYIIWAETFDTNGRMRISKAKVAIGSRY